MSESYRFLPVKIQPGFFDNEFTVIISTGGKEFESVVQKEDVEIESLPSMKQQGVGFLRVRIVSTSEDQVVIDMPRPSFTSQPRFMVSQKELVSR